MEQKNGSLEKCKEIIVEFDKVLNSLTKIYMYIFHLSCIYTFEIYLFKNMNNNWVTNLN